MMLEFTERCLICYALTDYASVDIIHSVYKGWKLIDILQYCTKSKITTPASSKICHSCSYKLEVSFQLCINFKVTNWSFHTNLRNECPLWELQDRAVKELWKVFAASKGNSDADEDQSVLVAEKFNENYFESGSEKNNCDSIEVFKSNDDVSAEILNSVEGKEHVDKKKERLIYLKQVARNLIEAEEFDIKSETMNEVFLHGSASLSGSRRSDLSPTMQDEDNNRKIIEEYSITENYDFNSFDEMSNESRTDSPRKDIDVTPMTPLQILSEDIDVNVCMAPVELIPDDYSRYTHQECISILDDGIRQLESGCAKVTDKENAIVTIRRSNRRRANKNEDVDNALNETEDVCKPNTVKKLKRTNENAAPSRHVNRKGVGKKPAANKSKDNTESPRTTADSGYQTEHCNKDSENDNFIENLLGVLKSEPSASPPASPEERNCDILESILKSESSDDPTDPSTGDSLHFCPSCNLMFKRNSCLQTHNRKVHNLDARGIYEWF